MVNEPGEMSENSNNEHDRMEYWSSVFLNLCAENPVTTSIAQLYAAFLIFAIICFCDAVYLIWLLSLLILHTDKPSNKMTNELGKACLTTNKKTNPTGQTIG